MRTIGEIAREMREHKKWSKTIQKEFCIATGILEKWQKASNENKEKIILEAASKFNVNVLHDDDVYITNYRGWELNYFDELKNMDYKVRKQLINKGYETEQEYYTAYEEAFYKTHGQYNIIEFF